MSRDLITEILNKIDAMVEARIVTFAQVAKDVGISPRTLYAWFGSRAHRPEADSVFKLQAWAAKKTLAVAAMPKHQAAYRSAYREICERFPVNGRNK